MSHVCIHVSILAGLPVASSAYSEHNARVAAPFHQLCSVGVVEALIATALKAVLLPNG